jgi:hypothetical protein
MKKLLNWLFPKKHVHDFKIPVTLHGYDFLKCTGCNMYDPVDDPKERADTDDLIRRIDARVEELKRRQAK